MGAFSAIFKGLVGGDPIKSISDLIDQFHMSPEQKAQMQQAAEELGAQREQIVAARDEALAEIAERNVENSRAMQVAVKSVLPPLLALTVTVGFFGLLYLLIFRSIPKDSHDIIIAMVGVLGAAWGAVVNYYFGSSSGSAAKTDALTSIAGAKK
jgi:Fe2+ transport system protein B